jgi:hypothetical protein
MYMLNDVQHIGRKNETHNTEKRGVVEKQGPCIAMPVADRKRASKSCMLERENGIYTTCTLYISMLWLT